MVVIATPASRPLTSGENGGMHPLSPHQRGFYSELLDAEMEATEAQTISEMAARGPPPDSFALPQFASPKQALPPAALYVGALASPKLPSDDIPQPPRPPAPKPEPPSEGGSAPSRAIQPKVLVPFRPGVGKTPRRIVIERQKRLFALQDIAQLLLELGVDSVRAARHRPVNTTALSRRAVARAYCCAPLRPCPPPPRTSSASEPARQPALPCA